VAQLVQIEARVTERAADRVPVIVLHLAGERPAAPSAEERGLRIERRLGRT
jgi:hypothetical protein